MVFRALCSIVVHFVLGVCTVPKCEIKTGLISSKNHLISLAQLVFLRILCYVLCWGYQGDAEMAKHITVKPENVYMKCFLITFKEKKYNEQFMPKQRKQKSCVDEMIDVHFVEFLRIQSLFSCFIDEVKFLF
jgi:hypothetical protein